MTSYNINENLSFNTLVDTQHNRMVFLGFLISGIIMGIFAPIDFFITKYNFDGIVEASGSVSLFILAYYGKKNLYKKWMVALGICIIAIVIVSIVLSNKAGHGIIIWLTLFPFLPFFLLGEKVGLWVTLATNIIFVGGLFYIVFFVPELGFTWLAILSTIGALTGSTIFARTYERHREEMIRHLSLEATTDILTGLLNRRGLSLAFKPLIYAANRTNQTLCFLILDLDFFKSINDTYGHDIGDDVIIQTANIIKLQIREGDIIARLGGEEFIVVLPNTPLKEAEIIAQRIRTAIEVSPISLKEEEISFTVSIGVSSTKEGEMNYNSLFKAADEALYKAKNSGRNCVVCNE